MVLDKNLMSQLQDYGKSSWQILSNSKSSFNLDNKVARRSSTIARLTSMTQGVFPFVYLGVQIFQDRCKAIYFDHLVEKVRRAWAGWKAKFLSFTLIKSILVSFPIYSLAKSNVPKSVLRSMERLMANFVMEC